MRLRIPITGSRDFSDNTLAQQALIWAANAAGVENPADVTVVHGDARGADTIMAEVAASCGCVVESHPAKWDELGKGAGIIRNCEMAALGADVSATVAWFGYLTAQPTLCVIIKSYIMKTLR